MKTLLDMPSAAWTGKEWMDENGIRYPVYESSGIRRCPRRGGIISQGLITANSESVATLLHMEYECVIVRDAVACFWQPQRPFNFIRSKPGIF